MAPRAPKGLGPRGRRLWRQVHAEASLDAGQVVILEEACRMADRLDELDSIIQGKGVLRLMQFRLQDVFEDDDERRTVVEVKFNSVLAEARQSQNVLKQLLVSLRLPDEAGVRPQKRGSRGAYSKGTTPSSAPQTPPRKVMESALEKAKRAAG